MVIAAGPVGRAAARRLARRELAKPEYRQHESFGQWLSSQINHFFHAVNTAMPGGWWSAVVLIAIMVALIAVVLTGPGPLRRSAWRPAGVPRSRAAALLGSREHRDLARRLAEAGDYSGASLEYMRAITACLVEGGKLPPRPARTISEAAAEAARLLPGQAAALAAAAREFDEICYGGRSGTSGSVQRLSDLDAAVTDIA